MAKIPTQKSNNTNKVDYELVAPDIYPARMVRFVGLGTQAQRAYQGKEKEPAPKVAVMFELYDPETGEPKMVKGKTAEGEIVERPSCVFKDYFLFPGAERGNVYDLSKALDPTITKVADDFEWFISRLGAPLMVEVTHYPKKDGTTGTSVGSVTGISRMVSKVMPPATSDLVGFDPYDGDIEKYAKAYSLIFNFQRTALAEAFDAQYIPLAGTEPQKFDDEKEEKSAPMATTTQSSPEAHSETNYEDDEDERPF